MISHIIDFLANIVIKTIELSGNFGVFFLMALESCGIPMPSEVIMPFAGYWVALGKMNFWLIVMIGTLGNLAGSLLAYWIAKKGGRPLIEKWGKYILISKHDLDLADKWFRNYGNFTVFFGRLLPVVRTYISFPAGIAEMDLKKFSIYTTLGALPWTALFAWLGVKMGENWEMVRQTLHNFDMAIGIGVLILIAIYIYRHIKITSKSPNTNPPAGGQ